MKKSSASFLEHTKQRLRGLLGDDDSGDEDSGEDDSALADGGDEENRWDDVDVAEDAGEEDVEDALAAAEGMSMGREGVALVVMDSEKGEGDELPPNAAVPAPASVTSGAPGEGGTGWRAGEADGVIMGALDGVEKEGVRELEDAAETEGATAAARVD